jgi:GDPmannose 4,6-dehydratase
MKKALWQDRVVIDTALCRPTEVDEFCGDPSKAAAKAGWRPKTIPAELVRIMVEADLADASLGPSHFLKPAAAEIGA